jgi:hypothetical protein
MRQDIRQRLQSPYAILVRHLRRKHGLSEASAKLVAELHYQVKP